MKSAPVFYFYRTMLFCFAFMLDFAQMINASIIAAKTPNKISLAIGFTYCATRTTAEFDTVCAKIAYK